VKARTEEFEGEMLTLEEIAARTGVSYHTIIARRNRYGIATAEAVAMGHYNVKRFCFRGNWVQLKEISAECGVSDRALRKAMKANNLTAEQAADIYIAKVHEYKGGMECLRDIAQWNDIDVGALRSNMSRHGKTAEQMVKTMLEKREEDLRYGKKRQNRQAQFKAAIMQLGSVHERVARLLANEIFADAEDLALDRTPDGGFEFGSEHYLFRVGFPKPEHATLESFWRSTGEKSMSRRYKYEADGKRVREITNDAFAEHARLLHTLQ